MFHHSTHQIQNRPAFIAMSWDLKTCHSKKKLSPTMSADTEKAPLLPSGPDPTRASLASRASRMSTKEPYTVDQDLYNANEDHHHSEKVRAAAWWRGDGGRWNGDGNTTADLLPTYYSA
jgi:hypothetical protein